MKRLIGLDRFRHLRAYVNDPTIIVAEYAGAYLP